MMPKSRWQALRTDMSAPDAISSLSMNPYITIGTSTLYSEI